MQTFTIGLGRKWFPKLWGHNGLVRSSDRLEAWVLAVVVALAVIAVPIAAAVGTAAHDTRLQMSLYQAHSRHIVSARVIQDATEGVDGNALMTTATAQWNAAGSTHVDTIAVPERVNAGDVVDVWVDDLGGSVVAAPTPPSEAADYAVGVAVLSWLLLVLALAGPCALFRRSLNRRRLVEWDRALLILAEGRHSSEQ